jgi:hypothetical protein
VWAVRTSQETHHVSATEPSRLMVCGETVAVCCENRMEHTDTLWAVRTSQETHHVSATEPSRLMVCGETVAVCCENRTEHTDTLCGQNAGLYVLMLAIYTYIYREREHYALNCRSITVQ